MKKIVILFVCVLIMGSANAAFIDRADFDSSAVDFDFAGLAHGTILAGDGNLTISNGEVNVGLNVGDVFSPSYYDGDDSSVIRFDFLSAISSIGLDFYSNNADTTLSIFGISDNLLESFTVSTVDQLPCNSFLCGYVGIDYGLSSISYAIIDTPLNGDELFIDNIIYQTITNSVPEPASLALLALGLIGIRFSKKKRKI